MPKKTAMLRPQWRKRAFFDAARKLRRFISPKSTRMSAVADRNKELRIT
jgi:hypothetical protein